MQRGITIRLYRVPEFWDWLIFHGQQGSIKIPIEVYEEFSDTKDKDGKKDDLATWAEQEDVKEALLFEEEAEQDLVARITYGGYVANPTDDELKTIGRDPFLISYALRELQDPCIVTTESQSLLGRGLIVTFLMYARISIYVALTTSK